jgi:hypothetical protein
VSFAAAHDPERDQYPRSYQAAQIWIRIFAGDRLRNAVHIRPGVKNSHTRFDWLAFEVPAKNEASAPQRPCSVIGRGVGIQM